MTENIAEKIREDKRPEGEMFVLRAEARRLRNSLAVAQRWLEVAEEEEAVFVLLTAKAEYPRDQLEEELSRTAFGMQVLRRQKELRHARPVEDPDRTARAAVLSDSLLSAYCALRDAPEEAFSAEAPERDRYATMGALMAALDAANAEMERCVGSQPA
jgi:hypothetical protein